MDRRSFFGASVLGGAGVFNVFGGQSQTSRTTATIYAGKPDSFDVIPPKLAGVTLEELRDDIHGLLFDEYLPFWDTAGYDAEHGGFMCELYDDGTVQSDEKFIWYQGRGIWVYSYLYNNLDPDSRWLEIARKTREFMINNMYLGDGRFRISVRRDGSPMEAQTAQGSSRDIYPAMFAASGLIQYYRAAGNAEDLKLAKELVRISAEYYNDPAYPGVTHLGEPGFRTQGHSFMMVWTLTQILELDDSGEDISDIEALADEHVDAIMTRFWNPDYGISNERLNHDYSRIDGLDTHMQPGHTLESFWMVMFDAIRRKNGTIFYRAKNRIKRVVEMCWDHVFAGFCDTGYQVFDTEEHPAGPYYDIKTMWSHCEILIPTITAYEYTGDVWAKEWFERTWGYVTDTMTTGTGVWRQAVDRFGNNKKRRTVTEYRRGNFHQPRALMYMLMSLNRIIENDGKLTAFPL